MAASTLAGLIAVGFATGLLAQFLTVYGRLEPAHDPWAYLGMGIIGAAGALSSIPMIMLLDYGRGATGSEGVNLVQPHIGFAYAAAVALFAKWLELADKRARFFLMTGLSLGMIALVLLVMLGRST